MWPGDLRNQRNTKSTVSGSKTTGPSGPEQQNLYFAVPVTAGTEQEFALERWMAIMSRNPRFKSRLCTGSGNKSTVT